MSSNSENSAGPQGWKKSVFIPIPKKGNAKECPNYSTTVFISHASKVLLKILQARIQHYMNQEIPHVQVGLRKGRGTRDQIANIRLDHSRNKKIPGKHLLLFYWLRQSLWLCGSQQTGKFLKRQEYQTTLPASWENCMQVKQQELELDMEQQTGLKLGKEYVKVLLSPCLFSFSAEAHHVKCWAGWSTSWNQYILEKYQWPQIGRWHHHNGRKWRGTKEPLDEGEKVEWKS